VYSDPRVIDFIQQHFTPVRVHVRDNADEFKRLGSRFNAQWTPTTLIVDSDGNERHRIEGFLPADDFLAQLALGLAHSAFARGDFKEAERLYRTVVDQYPDGDAAPEALYWAGVSRYKGSGEAGALGETAQAFLTRYTGTSWAKKASVWNK
jgi:TolA-binding protein